MPASSKPLSATPQLSPSSTPTVVKLRGTLRRFSHDRSGNVVMMFGLLAIPLVAMIGLAVDFGRVYSVTSHTQAALDAAATVIQWLNVDFVMGLLPT